MSKRGYDGIVAGSGLMTVREVLAAGTGILKDASFPLFPVDRALSTLALDAALLLARVLQTDRIGLILKAAELVSEGERDQYTRLLERRLQGESVAWILGYKEFWGLPFIVSPQVLVPRPDTETLVEAGLAAIDAFPQTGSCTLLDLCTGSGAVAIALKHERPSIEVYASDISPEALVVTKANTARLLPAPGIQRIESDLFNRIEGRFHIITANPPYVPSAVIPTLAVEVRREPRLSLDGGVDGLDLIRRILVQAKAHLYPGGYLLMEADPSQMQALNTLLTAHGYGPISMIPDLSGMPRVIRAGFCLRC
ncbi:MAG: peptide chain release factor N(5)-glutamine methyltransferase [Treponema sp.]|jgi:release factor glutamine methyltransferase|nr:peptide chain release factor N(5)-glutamine methyltransferase [Treponema sp.]